MQLYIETLFRICERRLRLFLSCTNYLSSVILPPLLYNSPRPAKTMGDNGPPPQVVSTAAVTSNATRIQDDIELTETRPLIGGHGISPPLEDLSGTDSEGDNISRQSNQLPSALVQNDILESPQDANENSV